MTFLNRIDSVKQKIQLESLDGIYITNLTNVRYLTGFTGSAGSLLIIDNEQHFFTDGRYIEQSNSEVKNCTINIVGGVHINAIKDLDDIINIDGIDGTFIGPYDLSGSLNKTGKLNDPEVIDAIEKYKTH